ncbi:Central kinetochore subunit CHL4 [Candida viswanathii]|uniref:Central kinetochore subunit CHL4 n=1 Tax=Candida viswanathii TaxID=5486 RepID=A0A367Y4Q7_9ASCO|nr:Central kinetochore subunit CHL4 [Candida viswanathii]
MSDNQSQGKRHNNVLPNTYIPLLDHKTLYNIIDRLSKNSILQFIILWTKLKNTQPRPPSSKYTQQGFINKILKEVKEFKQDFTRVPKRRLIDKIIYEYWAHGLNLLQISQIDCQLIVDKSTNAPPWVSSTVRDMNDAEVPISMNPQLFLHALVKNLTNLYLSYIYICKHPKLPIILIRIQVFDLNGMDITQKPHIVSYKPYFFGILVNSPHVIHSINNDVMVHSIVMQVFERSLPQNAQNLLKLVTPENQFPVKSIESMNILKGNSRFGNSLGIWTPYADGTVDMLPLGAIEDHQVFKQKEKEETPEDGDDVEGIKLRRLKKIANLRFKGSINGTVTPTGDGSKEDTTDESVAPSEFDSIAPIQYTEFTIREKPGTNAVERGLGDDGRTSIRFKITGSDIFGGLHELSVRSTDPEQMILNPEEVPHWLTGEEGASFGQIKDGTFIKS